MSDADGSDWPPMDVRWGRSVIRTPSEIPPWRAVPAWMERFGPDEPPIGTVLRWRRDTPNVMLDYLVVRVASGDWYATGRKSGPLDWEQVAGLIGDDPCDVAVSWREVPAPEMAPSGDDAVQDWAARFLPVSDHVDSGHDV